MNMASLYKRWVEEKPEKTAIICDDRRFTYAELDSLVNRFANGLIGLGLERGDVVSLFLPSCPELIISYLGIVRAGMVVNVVNAMLKEIEVEYILND
jgi:long-chain acyl-CoA synthetase